MLEGKRGAGSAFLRRKRANGVSRHHRPIAPSTELLRYEAVCEITAAVTHRCQGCIVPPIGTSVLSPQYTLNDVAYSLVDLRINQPPVEGLYTAISVRPSP